MSTQKPISTNPGASKLPLVALDTKLLQNEPLLLVPYDQSQAKSNNQLMVTTFSSLQSANSNIDIDRYFVSRKINPSALGSERFCSRYDVKYPYYAGAMANGIASEQMVIALASNGVLAMFGAAGLTPARVEQAIDNIQSSLATSNYKSFGVNLIHSPQEPHVELELSKLFERKGVKTIEASAYLKLTLPVVRYRLRGLKSSSDGSVYSEHRIVAKVSRSEVAKQFMSPAPEAMVEQLLSAGEITPMQAELARKIPIADDITAEADSGGHTDNRPLVTLLPSLISLRDQISEQYNYDSRIHVGAAGGISTPYSTLSAFALGADYVVTGTVNQACFESGSSDIVRKMLAETDQADITMAPAADMFELGVKLQVLKRGTMFAMRASKLYDIYKSCGSIEEIPLKDRSMLEKTIYRRSLDEEWQSTAEFFKQRDPSQLIKAEKDPRHKMALIFRSYLGQSSRWANAGVEDRKIDYQVWCGPAMGAFNAWTKNSFLEQPQNRSVVEIAENFMQGSSYLARVFDLKKAGFKLPLSLTNLCPESYIK